MARILTVTSGKGGVGKTNLSVNLAIYLAQKGHRTCLFDADLGLANINILLGIYPEYNLKDVIDGTKTLKEIIIHDKSGIDIIPGSSGVAEMETLSSLQLGGLINAFSELEEYDFFIFDTSAGVSKSVIAFCMSASEVILIITPEPTSLTDAYALMKILSMNGYKKTTKVVVNQSKDTKTSQIAYKKLKDTTRKFLGIDLSALGTIVADPRVIEAVSSQQPFLLLYPKTRASRCIKAIGDFLQERDSASSEAFALDSFWKRCLDIFSAPMKTPVRKEELSRKEPTPSTKQLPSQKLEPTVPPNGNTDPEIEEKILSETVSTAVENSKEPLLPVDRNQQILERLLEKITSVCDELSGIRKILEKGSQRVSGVESAGQRTGAFPPLIPLDFEAFLSKKKAEDESGAG